MNEENEAKPAPDTTATPGAAGGGGAGGGGGGAGAGAQGGASRKAGNIQGRNLDAVLDNPIPADQLVSLGGIIFTAIFLVSLTVVLLVNITKNWPACELPEDRVVTAGEDNRNANAGSNVNANRASNVNANANANAGAPTNTAAETNANVGAAAATPTPTPSPTPTPNASPAGTPAANAPAAKLDADSIQPKSGPITGKALVVIKGKGFGTDAGAVSVNFDGVDGKVGPVTDESISVRTPPHTEGVVDVLVEKKDGQFDVLRSEYTYTCPAPAGTSLFMMLIMAGALGGCIHAMRSFYWYAGHRELKWTWLPMYFALPFIGAAMAMLFSLLIFAGFIIDNTTGRGQALFVIAAAGLVGMFSQQAALKLTDIANAFFTKPGEGKDSKPQESRSVSESDATQQAKLTATSMKPVQGKAAGGEEVTIKGTGFDNSTVVRFGNVEVKPKSVTPTSLTVVTPQHAADEVDVIVKSDKQSDTVPTKFKFV